MWLIATSLGFVSVRISSSSAAVSTSLSAVCGTTSMTTPWRFWACGKGWLKIECAESQILSRFGVDIAVSHLWQHLVDVAVPLLGLRQGFETPQGYTDEMRVDVAMSTIRKQWECHATQPGLQRQRPVSMYRIVAMYERLKPGGIDQQLQVGLT